MENIALTLREVADQVNEEKEQKRESQHREVVNSQIIPFLQKEAEAGRYSASFPTPGYDIALIRRILRGLGFTADTFVYNKTHHLVVRW